MDLFMKTIKAVDQALQDSVKFSKHNIKNIVFSGGSSNIPFLQSALRDYFGHSGSYHGSKQPETSTIFGAAQRGLQAASDYYSRQGYLCCFGLSYLSVGIENADGVMVRFADRALAHEFDKVLTFSTAVDYQERMVIRVYEGERAMANQNLFLGEIELSGIPPAPKGVQRINVRISMGYCDGYFEVTATDMATEKANYGKVAARSGNLHHTEIDNRILEEKTFENQDKMIWENAAASSTLFILPE